jgi:hypothetical protein
MESEWNDTLKFTRIKLRAVGDVSEGFLELLPDGQVVDEGVPLSDLRVPCEHLHRRRLPRPIHPEKTKNLRLPHTHTQMIHSHKVLPVRFAQIPMRFKKMDHLKSKCKKRRDFSQGGIVIT